MTPAQPGLSGLLARLLINAAALYVAARFVPGLALADEVGSVLFVALVFGLVNALIKPVVSLLAFPAVLLTLGLFTLVVNAAMLGLTAWLTDALRVDGFGPALVGSLVVSLVSLVLSKLLGSDT